MSDRAIIRVRDVMQDSFVLLDGLATVQEAIDSMLRQNADTVFIRPRHEDDEHGIVVLADIAQKVLAHDRAPERINLYEIMTKPMIGVAPDMNIRYCARLFARFGLSTAPVVESRQILGVVTYREIVLHGLLAR
jgi:signal-transduction protein with cAMP-binding, CBS, and nucleotidyltransferase domain